MPLYAVLAREYFGPRIMGTVFGAATLVSSLGMAQGPKAMPRLDTIVAAWPRVQRPCRDDGVQSGHGLWTLGRRHDIRHFQRLSLALYRLPERRFGCDGGGAGLPATSPSVSRTAPAGLV